MGAEHDTRTAILMSLRAGRTQRSAADLEVADELVTGIAGTVLGGLDLSMHTSPAEVLRCVAIALAEVRQGFLAANRLDDRELRAIMPLLTHISTVAESLVGVSDGLAAEALGPDDDYWDNDSDGFDQDDHLNPGEPPW